MEWAKAAGTVAHRVIAYRIRCRLTVDTVPSHVSHTVDTVASRRDASTWDIRGQASDGRQISFDLI